MVKVTGVHAGRSGVTVTFDGELGGDQFAVLDVQEKVHRGRDVSVPGIVDGTARLDLEDRPLTAATIASVFTDVELVEGADVESDDDVVY